MSLGNLLVLIALASSIVLLVRRRGALALTATIASGIEAVLAFGIIRFGIRGVPLMLILALALAITGGVMLARERGKITVVAATLVALVGGIQVATRLLHL